ncbi:hypothetical protein [Streptomyces sp. NPDC057403]|uniref:hypothetical protein n=1 Tax=Streptomyces sp. NPDC057403 TaxID=3346119 RepID=UPI0036CA608A
MDAPLAALAVIRAALEDSPTVDLLQRPGWTTRRVVAALEQAGWTITPARPRTTAHTPPQGV